LAQAIVLPAFAVSVLTGKDLILQVGGMQFISNMASVVLLFSGFLTQSQATVTPETVTIEVIGAPGAPFARSFASAAWSASMKRMYVFGGEFENQSLSNELYYFDVEAESWTMPSPGGDVPVARMAAGAVWDDNQSCLYLFGGSTGGLQGSTADMPELFKYDLQTNNWTMLSQNIDLADSDDLIVEGAALVLRPANNSIMMLIPENENNKMELLLYDLEAGNWSLAPASDGVKPSTRYYASAAWNEPARMLYVFGGAGLNSLRIHKDALLVYDEQASLWTKLDPAGSLPLGRAAAVAAWTDSGMLVFGGYHATLAIDSPWLNITSAALNDLQLWEPLPEANTSADGEWMELINNTATFKQTALNLRRLSGGPEGRLGACSAYDAVTQRMYVYGGFTTPGVFGLFANNENSVLGDRTFFDDILMIQAGTTSTATSSTGTSTTSATTGTITSSTMSSMTTSSTTMTTMTMTSTSLSTSATTTQNETTSEDTTTTEAAGTPVTVTLAVEIMVADPTEITGNATYIDAMKMGLGELLDVSMDSVQVSFAGNLTATFSITFADQATAMTKTAAPAKMTMATLETAVEGWLMGVGASLSMEVIAMSWTFPWVTTTVEGTTTTDSNFSSGESQGHGLLAPPWWIAAVALAGSC